MTVSSQSNISEADAIQTVQKLESSFDLLQYKVDGWCFWPLIRFDVAMGIARLPFAGKDRFSRFQQLMIALQDIPSLFRLTRKKLVVKSYSSARMSEENGLFKDIYFDDLLDGCDQVIRIEGVNSKKMFLKRDMAKVPATLTSLPIELAAGMLSLLPWISPNFSEMAQKINDGLSTDGRLAKFTTKKILRKARFFYWGKKFYRWLLQRTLPEKILTADPGEYLISAAAKELGIPVIEFQHGLTSRDYNSFYSWTEYANPYKKCMPVSDAICLYGEYWKKDLEATGFWKEELHITGSILLDSFQCKSKDKKSDVCNIVLTSQGLDREELITMIQDFAWEAESDKEFRYNLTIKMHPVYDPDKSIFQTNLQNLRNIIVLEASEKPSTFELLSNADLHWSISSACHYDALGMGIPTIILGLKTHDSVLSLFENGYAFLARNAHELFEIAKKWKTLSVAGETRQYFYRSGALENVRKEIGQL